jgi:hypothetical protein
MVKRRVSEVKAAKVLDSDNTAGWATFMWAVGSHQARIAHDDLAVTHVWWLAASYILTGQSVFNLRNWQRRYGRDLSDTLQYYVCESCSMKI